MQTLRQMRRNAAGVVILMLVPVGLYAWARAQASVVSAPTVPTGASFSLALPGFRSERSASAAVARVGASGLPAFMRTLDRGAVHQVVVGPFVSIAETERAQRQLRVNGMNASLMVDESVRAIPQRATFTPVDPELSPDGAHLVLVGAGGGFSLVLEMTGSPGVVFTPRTEGTLLEVETGPLSAPVPSRLWNGPNDVDLVNQVAVGEFDRDGERFMRTQIALSRPVESRVRVVGSRVYVDFWQLSGS